MALANERSIPHEPCMMMSSTVLSPQIAYSAEDFHKPPFEEKGGTINLHPQQEPQSVINFGSFLTSSDQSVLSFEQKDEFYDGTSDQSYDWPHNHFNPRCSTGFNCFQTASDYGSISRCSSKGNQPSAEGSYGWLYSESTVTTESFEESGTQESAAINKRPHTGESMQAAKKQCTSNATNKKPKVQKPITPSKDPQSIAAKNRRERISERLKILQELVPNGSKVDLVTMLEKAISYVKFLQLQVKVLATDDFWPVQGGKAPDISQVREAIDAILSSSQRDRSSSSQ